MSEHLKQLIDSLDESLESMIEDNNFGRSFDPEDLLNCLIAIKNSLRVLEAIDE